MPKVGHLPLFERAPAASMVRANLMSQVILIFRVNQATQPLCWIFLLSYLHSITLYIFDEYLNKASVIAESPLQTLWISRGWTPAHHQLPELAQTHVHWVVDAIQPSHPLSSPSPPAVSLSQNQGLSQWVSSSHQMAKVLELHCQSFQWIFRVDFL